MNILNRFFPKHCISCDKQGDYLCVPCKRKLIPHPEICPYCHRTSKDYATCLDCKMEKENYLEGIIIPFAYTDEIKKLILKLKYYHKKDVIDFLVDRLILSLQLNQKINQMMYPLFERGRAGTAGDFSAKNNPSPFNVSPYRTSFGRTFQPFHVTFIPSHRYRKRFVKGYNQSELLARKLAVKLGLPSLQLVRKTKRTKSQAQLTRKQRLTNLQGAFSLKMNQLGTMNHELGTIFLVDDVTTTGSTLNQLAKVIKEKFPKIKVRGIVIARHMD